MSVDPYSSIKLYHVLIPDIQAWEHVVQNRLGYPRFISRNLCGCSVQLEFSTDHGENWFPLYEPCMNGKCHGSCQLTLDVIQRIRVWKVKKNKLWMCWIIWFINKKQFLCCMAINLHVSAKSFLIQNHLSFYNIYRKLLHISNYLNTMKHKPRIVYVVNADYVMPEPINICCSLMLRFILLVSKMKSSHTRFKVGYSEEFYIRLCKPMNCEFEFLVGRRVTLPLPGCGSNREHQVSLETSDKAFG